SVRGFCAGRRLSEPSFYSWRRTLRRRDAVPPQRPTLVPLRVVPDACVEVVLPTGLPAKATVLAVEAARRTVTVSFEETGEEKGDRVLNGPHVWSIRRTCLTAKA